MAQRPWQQITVPPVREAAANFKTPPREYGAIRWLTNGGEITRARIVSDLDQCLANGVFVVNIGVGEPPETQVPLAGAARSCQVRGRGGE